MYRQLITSSKTVYCVGFVETNSDEGDTSSSDSSENEFNILNSEELICCQVPLVPPSSPVSPSKNRLNRRVRTVNSFIWFWQYS